MSAKYIVGIDLGTTNSALARYDLSASEEEGRIELCSVPQLINTNEVAERTLLPSFLYIPGDLDFPKGSISLPWEPEPAFVVGELARKRGAESPTRLVASAKSWLSYAGVNRTSPILPWQAPAEVSRLSPVEASSQFLQHLGKAWKEAEKEEVPLGEQEILLTVPASFDEEARELTRRAAEQAGYQHVTLLEEPQAAFYAWLEGQGDTWRSRVRVGDLVLVCDVGGGTTDFSLIMVSEVNGELTLKRVAVGDHILLGGDNIDLALAGAVSARLAEKGTRIDSRQLQALWNNCRLAKEKLLDPESKAAEQPVTILGKGTGLVGGTIKATLQRADIDRVLADGFLPAVASTDMPAQQRRVGLQELGLPYAADAAITRHMARFLRQQAASVEQGAVRRGPSGLACPTHVLFNGGVLNAQMVRDRLLGTLNSWLAAEGLPAAQPLSGEDLMHAVSRGAAYYGLARSGRGVRIRGGVPRTYYVAIESAMPSIPGFPAPLKALAVVPFGMEEGTENRIAGREFGLVVGQPAEFRFFTSTARKNDQPGTMIEDLGDELEELAPMEVSFQAGEASEVVPVSFESLVTETGVLQLWCVARDGRRWKLEFNVRERVA